MGITELSLEVAIYPNPSSGSMNVILNEAIDGVIEVRDVQGRLIQSTIVTGQTTQIELDVESGTYFIQITKDGLKSKTKSVVIQ